MRIHLKLKTPNQIIPFDHQPLLTGTIHKWLGWNNEHGNVSLYSFSWLQGGKKEKSSLRFNKEASLFFSAHDPELIMKIVKGIQQDPTLFHGLEVAEITIQEDPDFSDREIFLVASPIFIKRKIADKIEHIIYNDPRAAGCLKETLQTKLQKAGLFDDDFVIRFDESYPKAGTKKVTYNGVENRANWCPVIIEGKPETKLFAWNVGLGNSTGIGFGALI